MHLAALWLAVIMTCLPLCAQADWHQIYGGRGDEAMHGAVSAGDGLFAVGYTYSSDATLSARKREGKTGWAMRLDGEGGVLWSCCSAHVGRDEMHSPFAHADGTFSCLLSGEGKGAEWLRISGEGKVTARMEIPQADALCPHGQGGERLGMQPCDRGGEAMLAIIVRHADGTFCMASMDEAGALGSGMPYQDGSDLVRVCTGDGRIAALYTQDAQAVVTWISPGGQREAQVRRVNVESGTLEWIISALAAEDGSILFGGQIAGGRGVIIRVSDEGEKLFEVQTHDTAQQLALTDTGFAAALTQDVMFFDEDGALLGTTPVDMENGYACMSSMGSGVALIENRPGSKTRQIGVTRIDGYREAADDVYEGVFFVRTQSRLAAAKKADGGVYLLMTDKDGQTVGQLVDHSGQVSDADMPVDIAPADGWKLNRGYLTWEKDESGARVCRTDDDGRVLWQTRTRIHTAADSLQWLCAMEEPDGGILLGGRYVTRGEGGARQEAVISRISRDGVLREMRTLEELGSICAMTAYGDTVCLLASGTSVLREEAAVVQRLDRPMREWTVLDVFLSERGVWMFEAQDGALLVAGTSERSGRTSAALQRLDALP